LGPNELFAENYNLKWINQIGPCFRCWVAGWGRIASGGSFSFVLRKADVPIYDRIRCQTRDQIFSHKKWRKNDEKVFANTPTNNSGNSIFSHFICTTCFNPELGPLQVFFN
jgi:hypothetical protein